MDTHALRKLVDAGIEAQKAFEEAEANFNAARVATDAARDRVKHDLSNLDHALAGACVIHGDNVLSVVFDTTKSMKLIKSVPLVQFKVVAPPSPPEVEPPAPVKSQPEPAAKPATATAAAATPTSGGIVPPLGKKVGTR